MKIQKHLKGYYKIHRSKSMNRKFVSGGPKLKSSGVYTEKFCEAVLEVWDMSYARGVDGFAGPTRLMYLTPSSGKKNWAGRRG